MSNSISLVVPVYNEEYRVTKCISSILSLSIKPDEIIFVDNNSRDKSCNVIFQNFENFTVPVKLVTENKQGIPFARNRGIQEAQGEIIVFLDGDCVAPPNYIEMIKNNFQKYRVDAICGRYSLKGQDAVKASLREKEWIDIFAWNKDALIVTKLANNCGVLVSGCTAYKKSVLIALGLFDEKYIYLDDVAISEKFYRNGFRAYIDPSIKVEHYIETDEWTICKKEFNYACDLAKINKLILKKGVIFNFEEYKHVWYALKKIISGTNDKYYWYLIRIYIYRKFFLLYHGLKTGALYL